LSSGFDDEIPPFAAIILAAGRGSRMSEQNKMLAEVAGMPVVRRTVEMALRTRAKEVVVVTGYEQEAVLEVLRDCSVKIAHNPGFAEGLSTSLRSGLSAVSAEIASAAILLGDMPLVEPELIDRLAIALRNTGKSIALPAYEGKRGNPVMWSRNFFGELQGIRGDAGARHLISGYEEFVVQVPAFSRAIFMDIDTEDDLVNARKAFNG
jgi:molybdenum cofactor cytidylyltransferase